MTLPVPMQQRDVPSTRLAGGNGQTQAICRVVAEKSITHFGPAMRSLILTGSLARDEGTFARTAQGKWIALGDAEFLLVLKSGAPLPPGHEVATLTQAIEESLSAGQIECPVSMGVCHDDFLLGLRPHIFAYELMRLGRVISGEEKILSLIPPFSASDIPLEDAWRMLSNRIVEQLKLADELSSSPEKLSENARYQVVKFILDMATSFLVFAGCYAPSYRERAARLRLLASEPLNGRWPFDLAEFSRVVETCTEWKLSLGAPPSAGINLWRSAVGYGQKLWVWELTRLTGGVAGDSAIDLMARWAKRQPLRMRIRGWFYVLRRERWRLDRLALGSFPRRVWSSSPRYDVYAAASRLFFELPEVFQSNQADALASFPKATEIIGRLPMRNSGQEWQPANWRHLAKEIIWNYNRYLVETRS